MALIINNTEYALVEAIKDSSLTIQAQGVGVDTNGDGTVDTPYCTNLAPTPAYYELIKPGSKDELLTLDAYRLTAIPLVPHLGPIGFHTENLAPALNFSGPAALLVYEIPAAERLTVSRKVMVSIQGSASTDIADTSLTYWLQIGATQTSHYNYTFSSIGDHRQFGGNWLITLPAGAATITLYGARLSGTGNLILNSADFLTLTVIG